MKRLVKKVFIIFTLINKIVPKKQNRIVFYSNLGFRDNVKALYDYLIENEYNKNYEIICSINDYRMFLDKNIKNVSFVNNYFGIFYFLTSKYFFYCFGKYPIKPSKKQVTFNLWHGMSIKKMGNLEKGMENVDYNYFDYVISTSKLFSPIMQKTFNCKEEQIYIGGQPRNDFLGSSKNTLRELNIDNYEGVIMWMPTFRNSSKLKMNNSTHDKLVYGFPLIDSNEQLKTINYLLKNSNYLLVIKPHPMQDISKNVETLSNILLISDDTLFDNNIQLYELLKDSCALITDYSSVYFDYLLINKPIGFIIDDMDDYINNRGFVFDDVIPLMPGKHIIDFDGLTEFLNDIFENKDTYYRQREELNNKVNTYKGFNSRKRILNFCGIVKGDT